MQLWSPQTPFADVRAVCPRVGLGPVVLNAEKATLASQLMEARAMYSVIGRHTLSQQRKKVTHENPECPANDSGSACDRQTYSVATAKTK